MQLQPETTTLYVKGRSRLHRAHPFTKLSFIVLSGTMAYLLPWGLPGNGILILANLGLAFSCGVVTASWKALAKIMLPLSVFMLPIHGLFHADNQTALISVYDITFYREGSLFALGMLLRIAVVLTSSFLFVFTTHPSDLISAIAQTAGSPTLAYLVGSPMLMLPAMRQRIEKIQSAQRARGLDSQGNIFKRALGVAPLVIPLVIGALIEMEQRATALEIKGFRSKHPKTFLRIIHDSGVQRHARRIMLVTAAGIILFKWFK